MARSSLSRGTTSKSARIWTRSPKTIVVKPQSAMSCENSSDLASIDVSMGFSIETISGQRGVFEVKSVEASA